MAAPESARIRTFFSRLTLARPLAIPAPSPSHTVATLTKATVGVCMDGGVVCCVLCDFVFPSLVMFFLAARFTIRVVSGITVFNEFSKVSNEVGIM